MGMEPESMEFSTLGGWIATKTKNMKHSRYGNIDEMLVEVRVATSSGLVWQRGMKDRHASSTGRRSTGLELPGLLLGSEGCLGVITAAVVRIHPLPEVLEYESLEFTSWDLGVSFMRQVSQLPRALKPACFRLLDNGEFKLAEALREDLHRSRWRMPRSGQESVALLLFEGSGDEVAAQRQEVSQIASSCSGTWTGPAIGEALYQMYFVIPYVRDFGMDYSILCESFELLLPWSRISGLEWPSVVEATAAKHQALQLPGVAKLWKGLLPSTEGGLLRLSIATSVEGFEWAAALEAFQGLQDAARRVLEQQADPGWKQDTGVALTSLKAALDPHHVLG